MEAVLKKWGNSAAIRLPAPIVKECHLRLNQSLEIIAQNGMIIIKVQRKPLRYKLSDLLAEVTESNLHESIDFGLSTGNEAL